jgi:hypothetical protein
MLQEILNTLNSVPKETWATIAQVVGSAFIVSPVALAIKKWFSVDGEKKMTALVILFSMVASAVVYLQDVPQFAPWFVAVQGLLVYATSQPVYFFFIKPLFARIGVSFSTQVAKAVAYRDEVQSAEVPAQGLPLSPVLPSPEHQDFSH